MSVMGLAAGRGGSLAWGAPAAEGDALRAVRHALAGAGPPPRVALRLSAPAAPHRRRAARIVLQDVARADGGRVLDGAAAGELLLLGATPEGAARAEAVLAAAWVATPPGSTPPITLWRLPEDAAPLLAWAEAAGGPPPTAPDLAGLDAALEALPLEAAPQEGGAPVLLRRAVIRLGAGGAPGLAWRRIALSRRALAGAIGPLLRDDPDLLDHAIDRVAHRVPSALGPPAGAPPMLPQQAVPEDLLLPPRPGAVAVLPVAATLRPGAAERWRWLAEAGWALGFDGLDAAALRLFQPMALPPGSLLLLRWSPALGDERSALAALREIDPTRLVLTGCDGPQALGWGLSRGIAHFAGPAIEALRAAER
jgi:hypothetical protein